MELPRPYLLFLGDVTDPSDAKTAFGLRDWCGHEVLGQLRLPGGTVDLGLPELGPAAAAAAGCRSLVIGIAPVGGRVTPAWVPTLVSAMESGMDVVSGLHTRLESVPALAEARRRTRRSFYNVRHTDRSFPAGDGTRRSGKRLLTIGTDCALGKKYTALALTRALRERGVDADFRATGQTGVMIAGRGVAIDAVVADFIAGAAEWLSPANHPEHWDVIEGQGSLHSPAYAGVSLGLLHGSQPDALVLCHDPSRTHMVDLPHVPMPDPQDALDLAIRLARRTNPQVRAAALSLNTSRLSEPERRREAAQWGDRLGLPVFDPMRGDVGAGVGAVCDQLLEASPVGPQG